MCCLSAQGGVHAVNFSSAATLAMCMHAPAQVRAGVERVRDILLSEDKDMPISIPPDAFSYIDVLPEMVGYVLGSRCA